MDQIGGAKFTEPAPAGTDRFELQAGGYALVAEVPGAFAADRPFTVSTDLSDLTRGLRR